MSDPRKPGPLDPGTVTARGGAEPPVDGAAVAVDPAAPTTPAERIAALEALGLDRDVAIKALKALGEDVEQPPDSYRVDVTIVGPELRPLLEDALERNADDEPRMNATAEDALGLVGAVSYDVEVGSLVLRFEAASAGPLNALSLVEDTVEVALRNLGLEKIAAEELGARLAGTFVGVSAA